MRHSRFLLILAFFLCACVAGQSQFDVALQLSQAGKDKEALAYLEQALAQAPDNPKYRQAKNELETKLLARQANVIERALAADPLTLDALNTAKAAMAEARAINPAAEMVTALQADLDRRENGFLSEIEGLYAETNKLVAGEQWLAAYFNLQQINSRFPNYKDSLALLQETTHKGPQAFYQAAEQAVARDDFETAGANLRNALSLQGDHGPSRDLLEVVRQRDNKAYFVEKCKQMVAENQWDEAVQACNRALRYSPEDGALQELTGRIEIKAAEAYTRKAQDMMKAGRLYKAMETYRLAAKYQSDATAGTVEDLRRNLCARAARLAQQFKEDSYYGSAWYWYRRIAEINPEYKDIFYLTQEMEDKIAARVRKSIAVFDFSSPRNNADAGIIVANNLITFLFETASGDIKILERENLKSILEEMKLGQIGVVSSNSAKEMGRVYGIDVAIMGSVLLFKVDSTSSEGTKTVRYQVGTKIEDNIAYLNWRVKNPNPNSVQLAQAPPAKVTIPEFAEKDYKVSQHKKIGFLQTSFRIVDVSTGENIQVKTLERKEVAEDVGSAGLPEAKVEFDPVEIPSDTELLQKMTEDVVAELGREALRPLQNLEKLYFQEGEKHLRRRNGILAAESFIDAIFDEKMKRISASPLSQRAQEHLDTIFAAYTAKIEG